METPQRRGAGESRDREECPRLTLAQACRLWQMADAACEAILLTLVAEGFLARTTDGAFIAMPTRPRAESLQGRANQQVLHMTSSM
jgi:hypothetical protein